MVETAERGEINFITDMIHYQANEHDVRVHEQLHQNNLRRGLSPKKLFADTGYVSGESLKKCADWELQLMGYLQATTGRGRENRFLPDGFKTDVESRTAICPAGHRNTHAAINKRHKLKLRFDPSACEQCRFLLPYVKVVSDKAVKSIISVGEYCAHIRERRIGQKAEVFPNQMRVRAQVEGTISEAIRMHGLRYARYHGKEGHQLKFYLTGAALNIRRIARALKKGQDGSSEA